MYVTLLFSILPALNLSFRSLTSSSMRMTRKSTMIKTTTNLTSPSWRRKRKRKTCLLRPLLHLEGQTFFESYHAFVFIPPTASAIPSTYGLLYLYNIGAPVELNYTYNNHPLLGSFLFLELSFLFIATSRCIATANTGQSIYISPCTSMPHQKPKYSKNRVNNNSSFPSPTIRH